MAEFPRNYGVTVHNPEEERAFLDANSRIEGLVIRPPRTDDLRKANMKRYLDDHRRRVERFTTPKDPETEDMITVGLFAMLTDLINTSLQLNRYFSYGLSRWYNGDSQLGFTYLAETLDLSQRLAESFLECINTPPVKLDLIPRHLRWKNPILHPVEVECLMYRYGLIDGIRQDMAGVNVALGLTPGSPSASRNIGYGISNLRDQFINAGIIKYADQPTAFGRNLTFDV